jgi:DEAD/DEAH box helicase domain-containing protein
MRKIVFDLETKNLFREVGKADPALLDISIVCVYDSETGGYTSYLEEELDNLWPIIECADLLVGYNSDHFDIPILNKYYSGDLFKIKSVDIMKEIHKALGRRVRLDAVAEGTLGEKKTGHGLDAIRWWKEGNVEKVRKYCLDDVRITKEIYDYALTNGKVLIKNIGGVREVQLDTSEWENKENSALTHTLPF